MPKKSVGMGRKVGTTIIGWLINALAVTGGVVLRSVSRSDLYNTAWKKIKSRAQNVGNQPLLLLRTRMKRSTFVAITSNRSTRQIRFGLIF